MKLITITRPDFFEEEAGAITALFDAGLEILHLRKPGASYEEMEKLLRQLPPEYLERIVIHDHFRLLSSWKLKGVHLNGRNPTVPADFTGHVSRSCHSLEEVAAYKAACDYVFLSPIYDSISKEGYASAYTFDGLQQAQQAGIIDAKVMALGGVAAEHFSELSSLGFGGVALLGDIWKRTGTEFINHFKALLRLSSFPVILTIAGSDCSGGAGIQADIKTISALKGYAASVITAVTAQNTVGVQAVYPVPADIVRSQIESVMDDLQPVAVKIGMVHNAAIVRTVAACLQKYRPRFVVYDPVMVSTSGRQLMTEDTVHAIQEELFPRCSLITPNLSEASLLLSHPVTGIEEMKQAACELAHRYHCSVLVKGGHLSGNTMCDVLYDNGSISLFEQQKIESHNLHGTGCTLSSAIATFAANGCGLEEAVRQAKAYIGKAILYGKDLRIGHGNGPLCHFFPEEQ